MNPDRSVLVTVPSGRIGFMLVFFSVIAVSSAVFTVQDFSDGRTGKGIAHLAFAFLFAWYAAGFRQQRVVEQRDGLTILPYMRVRARTIPWSSITAITPVRRGLSDQLYIEHDGRRTIAMGINSSSWMGVGRKRFDEGVAAARRAVDVHRSPNAEPSTK